MRLLTIVFLFAAPIAAVAEILVGNGEFSDAQKCFDYHYPNLRAAMSADVQKAIAKIELNQEGIADFKRLKAELESDMKHFGMNVTDHTALDVAQVAKTIEATANLVNNLLKLHPGYQAHKKANPVYAITLRELNKGHAKIRKDKRQRELTGLDGKYTDAALKELEKSLPKGNTYLHALAKTARDLAQDVDDLRVMPRKHAQLKSDVERELDRIDRQISKYESNIENSHEILALYREQETALVDYCAGSSQENNEPDERGKKKSGGDIFDEIDKAYQQTERQMTSEMSSNQSGYDGESTMREYESYRARRDKEISDSELEILNQLMLGIATRQRNQGGSAAYHPGGSEAAGPQVGGGAIGSSSRCDALKQQVAEYQSAIARVQPYASSSNDHRRALQAYQAGLQSNRQMYQRECSNAGIASPQHRPVVAPRQNSPKGVPAFPDNRGRPVCGEGWHLNPSDGRCYR